MPAARSLSPVALILVLLLSAAPVTAAPEGMEYTDDAALSEVSEGRGVFLVDIGSPDKLALYLNLIPGTYQRLEKQGVDPDFVLVFIGPSVKHLTKPSDSLADLEHGEALQRIRQGIDKLQSLEDVRLEVCNVALEVMDVAPERLLPGMKIVSDGFISVIGYQEQGYHLVPVY
ncbi:DsrE family protein [Thiohalorhabdus sp.]|uniref:DsrE family protein n=1 Tax=Thiohalorhabdus sp. TaxID=3094134 RepID=UPI002FC3DD7A